MKLTSNDQLRSWGKRFIKKMNLFLICTILLSAHFSNGEDKVERFDNFKVFRFFPEEQGHLDYLRSLEDKIDEGLNFWQEASLIGEPVDIMFPPEIRPENFTKLMEMKSTVFVDNVQALIDHSDRTDESRLRSATSLNWNGYFSVDEIYKFMAEQNAKYPAFTQVINIGKSTEGRDLKVFKIAKPKADGTPKKAIFIDANVHAREWVTGATATFAINQLLNSDNAQVQSLSEDYDFYIMPMVNPDGYEFSRASNRLWRKTRSKTGGKTFFSRLCVGTDANRNWGDHWRTGGSSTNPCSDTYAGPNAFSEPEIKAIADFYKGISANTAAYLSIHSYSQLILFPYGYTRTRIPRYDEYKSITDAMAATMSRRHGQQYKAGNIVELLYVSSGSSIDWVAAQGTKIALAYELRDKGSSGFVLPPNQIIPTAQEFMSSVLELSRQMKARNLA